MSVLTRAAIGAAILAFGIAPAAEAKSQSHKHKHDEAAKTSKTLRKEITSKRMLTHLKALQMISDENGGNPRRASRAMAPRSSTSSRSSATRATTRRRRSSTS